MHTDKRIALIVAASLPIVIFVGASALCILLMIVLVGTDLVNIALLAFVGACAPSLILSISAVFPWLKDVPRRWALSVAGLIPTVVLSVVTLVGLGGGHDAKVLAALSPMIGAVILPLLPFFSCFRQKAIPTRKRVVGVSFSIVLLIAVLWSAFWLWAITDSTFMVGPV